MSRKKAHAYCRIRSILDVDAGHFRRQDVRCDLFSGYLDQLITVYREATRGIALILSSQGKRAGLLVDEVTGLISCAQTMPRELPRGENSYLAGVVLNGKHPLLRVDVKRLPFLNEEEPPFFLSRFRDSQA